MRSGDIEAVRQMLAAGDLGALSLSELRQHYDDFSLILPTPDQVTVETLHIGGVPAEKLSGATAVPGRSILYFHGGGYVIGSPKSHRHVVGAIAEAAEAAIIVPDYRLAPEHPYPAAVDDAVAVYQALLAQGQKPDQLIVAGDSAGGGLTLATLIAARDQGLPLPAAAVLISPWVDLACAGESFVTLQPRDPIINAALLEAMAGHYLNGFDPLTPFASPLYADLTGLPPMLIQVGTDEMLLDDSRRLEQRAREHGVEAVLEVWDEMIHVWHFFHPRLREGREAIDRLGAYIRAAVTAAPAFA